MFPLIPFKHKIHKFLIKQQGISWVLIHFKNRCHLLLWRRKFWCILMVNRNLLFSICWTGDCQMQTHLQSHNVSVHINTHSSARSFWRNRYSSRRRSHLHRNQIQLIFLRSSTSVLDKLLPQYNRHSQLKLYQIHYTAHFVKPNKLLRCTCLYPSDHVLTVAPGHIRDNTQINQSQL
jgi:hypothetical protein